MTPNEKVVLIIDDDDDVREAVMDTLTDEGYRAAAVATGAAGLAYLRDMPAPALILLDWNMTPMNGPQFMAAIADEPRWSSIPIVLLTADARVDDKAKLAPFASYLRKPVRLTDLFGVLAKYCS